MSRLERAERSPWRRLSTRLAFESPNFDIREDRVVAPDGSEHRYPYVAYRVPVVTVAAVTDAAEIYLVRQWRHPWQSDSWELPAGHCEPGEAPEAAAPRELREEAGLSAAEWTPLPLIRPGASLTVLFHPYLARGLSEVATARDGTEADMVVRRLPLAEAVEVALAGEIQHAVSVAVILSVARRLGV